MSDAIRKLRDLLDEAGVSDRRYAEPGLAAADEAPAERQAAVDGGVRRHDDRSVRLRRARPLRALRHHLHEHGAVGVQHLVRHDRREPGDGG